MHVGDKDEMTRTERDNVAYYFAYGSCMSEDFARTVPEYEVLGRALLRDYRLAFTRYSRGRSGGVADVVSAPGKWVEGVLYRISLDDFGALDVREGVPSGVYRRIEVTVEVGGREERAYTYEVVEKAEVEIPPSKAYAGLILDGARAYLSTEYERQVRDHIANLTEESVEPRQA